MNPITLPVAELKPALAGLGKIISKRVTLPVLGCVLIERTREGRVELTGTDLDRSATVRLDTPDQGEPTTILLPLEDLANLTKTCGRKEVLMLVRAEDNKAAIRFSVAGQILEHLCESLPVAEFPAIEEVGGNPVVLDSALRQSIQDALACASTDETRFILNGAYIDVSNPCAHYVVGTDGRHLFSSNSFNLALRESLIVPSHPFVGWKGFNEDGDWRLRMKPATKDQPPIFELASEHWRFVSRSYDGIYPNWRQIVPSGKDITGSIEIPADIADSILQTITRLPEHDAINRTIGIEVEAGAMHLLAKANADQPWTRIEVLGAKVTCGNLIVLLNRLLLMKALRFGLTRIDLIDARSPVRFREGGRQMIVMVIRTDPTPSPTTSTPPPVPTRPAASISTVADQPKQETNMPAINGTHATATKGADTIAEASEPALELALAQLEVVCGDFRNAVAGVTKVADLLKQAQREQKTSEKEISSVRATLRSLQGVRTSSEN